ncbi:Potassium transporter 11 [Glycine soja]
MGSRVDTDEDNDNRGSMWDLDQKLDQPMDEEAGRLRNMYREKKFSALLLLRLAFQSLGVVYGDLGTSPLYVFYNTFPNGVKDEEDVIGALSLIIYSLTLVPLLKYVFVVLRANDNGQGGTFALYSLLCRHAKIKTIPNQHRTDEELTTYSRSTFHERSFAAKTKRWLEEQESAKRAILILVLVGTCMVIGDGILTPAISDHNPTLNLPTGDPGTIQLAWVYSTRRMYNPVSYFKRFITIHYVVVLSAVGGIKVNQPRMSSGVVVLVAVVILVGFFSMQHYGTDRVSWLFAPIVLLWFLLIGGIGIFNIWKYGSGVLKAFSPVYIYRYFRRGGKEGWTSLGGIMLSITGTEALFADLAHFPVSAVQLAFTLVVFPCLLLAYSGQAAYLMNNLTHSQDAFYRSIPDRIYWPVFIIATLAAIVASQATITATFSIIKQALALGCFPRVKVVYTSKKFLGQIYVPDINWILMILCIAVTAGFENQNQIGNAYERLLHCDLEKQSFCFVWGVKAAYICPPILGTAVVIVMLVTTLLMILIMILVWRCHWILVLIFTGLSLIVECTYFSSVLFKVDQGGWVPLAIAGAFLIIMSVWHYGTVKRYEFEMHSKVSMAWILGLGPSLGLVRVPGIGLVYTELASGVPHIFSHFITNLPAIHSVVVFVCVKYLPVYTVPEAERFLVKRIGPKNFHIFRCVARYGYKDLHKKDDDFEKKLFENLFTFVRLESMMEGCSDSDEYSLCGQQIEHPRGGLLHNNGSTVSSNMDLTMSSVDSIVPVRSPHHMNITVRSSGQTSSQTEVDELEFLTICRDAGVVHILGNTVVRARRESRFYKKIAVDYIYAFLRKICRENCVIFNVPHESLLNVGQIFYV